MYRCHAAIILLSAAWLMVPGAMVAGGIDNTHSDHTPDAQSANRAVPPNALLVNLRVGPEAGLSASDFFRVVEQTTGASSMSFSAPVCYHAALKVRRGVWAAGIDAGYIETTASGFGDVDVYSARIPDLYVGMRSSNHQVKIESIPIALCVEYNPSTSQFREFVGAGIGASFTNVRWNEEVSSTVVGDRLQSGLRFARRAPVPLARISAGVELCFDNYFHRSAGSILVELSYTYAPNLVTPFASLPESDTRFIDRQSDKLSIGAGAVRLLIGLQLATKRD